MGANRLTLIQQLQAISRFDSRFTNISVCNCDPLTGLQLRNGGSLSVVFHAIDDATGQPVAIKFFDPEVPVPQIAYRYALFRRECDLLGLVAGNERCLQLIQPLQSFELVVSDPATGHTLKNEVYYFITEWIDTDINDYFLNQQNISTIDKLGIFREIVLSVFALHRNTIYHRDLKPDNLRIANRNGVGRVVAIDLGTAAAYHSSALGAGSDYLAPVGADGYAPIESHCGLAGVRDLGVYGDLYALGCMLFDLFNVDYFFIRLFNDSGFQSCFMACKAHMMQPHIKRLDEGSMLREWGRMIDRSKRQVTVPNIAGAGSSVPASVLQILTNLLKMLVSVDYRDRQNDLNKILRHIDASINILQHARADQVILSRRRLMRQRRQAKLRQREMKLVEYLARRSGN